MAMYDSYEGDFGDDEVLDGWSYDAEAAIDYAYGIGWDNPSDVLDSLHDPGSER